MFSLWLIYALIYHYHVTAQCNNALSCIGDLGDVSDDTISGNGYKSLFQSPSSTTHFRKCNGALSCSQTPQIDTNYLECFGTSSCSNTASIKANNYISGDGSNALKNVNISHGAAVSCNGDKGCAHSTISSSSNSWTLSAYGALSLFETTITVKSSTLNAKLYGYYASYDSTIYCVEGSICTIECWHNGCDGLSLICDVSSQCTNIVSKTNIITSEVLLWNSTAIIKSNEEKCLIQPTDRTFDDYYEHSDESDIDIESICCRAGHSCKSSNYSISSNINNTAITTAYVVCSAYYSCNKMHIISNNNNNIAIMVECSAVHSCLQSVINTNGGNLYCFGDSGCYQAQIQQVSNLYCSGGRSCQLATITSSGKDIIIHLTGYQSGGSSQVICNENDDCTILCDAYLACSNMELNCYGTCHVECNQDTRCPNGWTSNPTLEPTVNPTSNPTVNPTINPTSYPTVNPTVNPTSNPTVSPTELDVTDGNTKTITIIGFLLTVFCVVAI